jgi:uncharacterized protein YcbK (DUF882 family)
MYFRPRAFRRRWSAPLARWVAGLAIVFAAHASLAEAVHLVRDGDTLGGIAIKYGVSEESLRDANKLSEQGLVRLGQKLVIPSNGASTAPGPRSERKKGSLRLIRGTETLDLVVRNRKRHLISSALPEINRMLRYPSGEEHGIDRRLVSLLATVSDHFEGRDIIVVSGFRPYAPTQYTPHSNHNVGKAIDFMVRGVPNEVVRDFCRTLRNVGVGFYPNSSFVHMDVRKTGAYWVDYAGSGQRPRYHRSDPPPLDPDEGAGEVPMDLASLAPSGDSASPAGARVGELSQGGSQTTTKRQTLSSGHQTAKSQISDSTGEARLFPGRD